MRDKICIVTGANTGIGKATVEGLARQGATVVLACRDLDKAAAAVTELAASTGSNHLHPLALDLGSLVSVRGFVAAFTAKFQRLDVLIENAGVSTGERRTTVDGFEMDFGVNHLGHFLLTELLLPTLKASAPSRIVVVSSSVHKGAKLDFDDLQAEKDWGSLKAYGVSKLANLLFVHALSRRLEGTGVVANALHPGVVSTELARDFPAVFRWMARWFFTTPEKGARTSLYLATSPEAAKVSGEYFADSKELKPAPNALDAAAADRLWAVSEKLVGIATA